MDANEQEYIKTNTRWPEINFTTFIGHHFCLVEFLQFIFDSCVLQTWQIYYGVFYDSTTRGYCENILPKSRVYFRNFSQLLRTLRGGEVLRPRFHTARPWSVCSSTVFFKFSHYSLNCESRSDFYQNFDEVLEGFRQLNLDFDNMFLQ